MGLLNPPRKLNEPSKPNDPVDEAIYLLTSWLTDVRRHQEEHGGAELPAELQFKNYETVVPDKIDRASLEGSPFHRGMFAGPLEQRKQAWNQLFEKEFPPEGGWPDWEGAKVPKELRESPIEYWKAQTEPPPET